MILRNITMEIAERITCDSSRIFGRSIGHPREHKLRFTRPGHSQSPSPYRVDRSRTTLTNLPLSRETSFEIERPQSHSRLVINIATSYRKKDRLSRYSHKTEKNVWKPVPSLPLLSSPIPTTRILKSSKIDNNPGNIGITGEAIYTQFRRARTNDNLHSSSPVNMSTEKHTWIANWIQDTNNALDKNFASVPTSDSLPVIKEYSN